jgi:hypothetical protein
VVIFALSLFSDREESAMKMIFKLIIASVTFLFFFYSNTFAMSLMYGLDSALLRF